jgi:uncharacterized protein YgiM (DUF1202 family)
LVVVDYRFMQTVDVARASIHRSLCRRAAFYLLVLTFGQLSLPPATFGQASPERVRVPTSYANVHMGPSSGQEVLVLVPRGTVLTVVGRDKEWIQVQLSPELRKTGMVMRWYKNETRGWMHDSTVEPVKSESR